MARAGEPPNYSLPCLAPVLEQIDPEAPITLGQALLSGPARHAEWLEGLGEVVFPLTTDQPEVRRLFDQGVALLHGMWYREAERAFRQAHELEPENPMVLWGLALANEGRPGRARLFAHAAQVASHEKSGPEEKLWLAALAHFYEVNRSVEFAKAPPLDRGLEERSRELVHDLETIVLAAPESVEAKAFLLRQLVLNEHRLGISAGSHVAVDLLAREIEEKAPGHPARHYRTFLWLDEAPARAAEVAVGSPAITPGLADGWRYAAEAHAAAGRTQEAALLLEAALRVDRRYLAEQSLLPREAQNLVANQAALARLEAGRGRIEEALALAEELAAFPRMPGEPGSAAFHAGRSLMVETLMRAEQWDRLLTYIEDRPELKSGPGVADRADVWLWRGLAQLHLENGAAVREVLAELEALEQGTGDAGAKAAIGERLGALRSAFALWNGTGGQGGGERRGAAGEGSEEADALRKWLPAETLARLCYRAGKTEEALAIIQAAETAEPGRFLTAAAYVELNFQAGNEQAALYAFDRKFRARASLAEEGLPILNRLDAVAARMRLKKPWTLPAPEVDWASLSGGAEAPGPAAWLPPRAPAFTLPDHTGKGVSLESFRGRPVILNFFLGVGCIYCAQQINQFRPYAQDFAAEGIEVIEIGTDPVSVLQKALGGAPAGEAGAKERIPFLVLSDENLETFRAYGVVDDYGAGGMHATFLLDGEGRVLWRDVSHLPFKDPAFLLEEARRLLELHAKPGS